jgi:thioredoxin 1
MAEITPVTDATFDAEVLASPKPVLVDFYADWCGPCRALLPALHDIAREYEGPLSVKKLNVDENPATREGYGISSIPALLFFKKGAVSERMLGAQSRTTIAAAVDRLLDETP